ncbi:hypothetical protein R1sor_000661 [Riccia sorocarpa]|uniref:Reverse transcriptase zinc-binding domain-containing protein n=1 Tax=Riccia sorocarpa TaxID=122646 RepID=A0ABD3GZR6_9MARC
MAAYGAPGVQWLYSASKSKAEGQSLVLSNIFKAWAKITKFIHHNALHNEKDWREIALWGSAQASKDRKIRRVNTQAKGSLWEGGYRTLEDLTTSDGRRFASWEQQRKPAVDQRAVEKAYRNLGGAIEFLDEVVLRGEDLVLGYFEANETPGEIWEWQIAGADQGKVGKPPAEGEQLRRYKETEGAISHWAVSTRPAPNRESRRDTRIPWRTGEDHQEAGGNFSRRSSGTRETVPTNSWRYPALPRTDPLRWCKRCWQQENEDTYHVFWKCPKAQTTWSVIENLVRAVTKRGRSWRPKCNQILLAEDLPKELERFKNWWGMVRGATLWTIWLARNALNFSDEVWNQRKIDSALWYRMTLYTRAEWRKLKPEEREDFKVGWGFEYAGIVTEESGGIKIPRLAPWLRTADPNTQRSAHPNAGDG